MRRNEFHYALSVAAVAEAGIRRGGMSPEEVFERAVLAGRCNGTVDWCDDRHVTVNGWKRGDRRTITQQSGTRGIKLMGLLGNGWLRNFEATELFHFNPDFGREAFLRNGHRTLQLDFEFDELVELMLHLHNMQDAGFDGCPHSGYLGVPSPANKAETIRQGRLKWYNPKRLLPASKCWGHAYDPSIDNIENSRDGAVASTKCLLETLAGEKMVIVHGTNVVYHAWPSDRAEPVRSQCMLAVEMAKNDEDLEQRCRRIVHHTTGFVMPEFKPLHGDDLEVFFESALTLYVAYAW